MRRARRASTSSGTLLARTMSPSTRPAMSRTVERSGSSRPTPTISTKPCFHASSSAPRSTSSRNSIEVCRPSSSASSRTIANGGASLSAAERASRGGASSAASNPGKYSPSTPVRRSARPLALPLGTYPSAATASSTRSRVTGRTASGERSTRETVAIETPARSATSYTVAALLTPTPLRIGRRGRPGRGLGRRDR